MKRSVLVRTAVAVSWIVLLGWDLWLVFRPNPWKKVAMESIERSNEAIKVAMSWKQIAVDWKKLADECADTLAADLAKQSPPKPKG